MAINYSTLKTFIADAIHRNDLGSRIPTFIEFAEDWIRRDLSSFWQETRATAVLDAEYISLPIDYVSMRNIEILTTPAKQLVYLTPEQMDNLADATGEPTNYTIQAKTIEVSPTPAAAYTIQITYLAGPQALSDTNPTNDILDRYPSLYLHGSLANAYDFIRNEASADRYRALFMDGIEKAKIDGRRSRWGGGAMTVTAG